MQKELTNEKYQTFTQLLFRCRDIIEEIIETTHFRLKNNVITNDDDFVIGKNQSAFSVISKLVPILTKLVKFDDVINQKSPAQIEYTKADIEIMKAFVTEYEIKN
jgi:hypothetical protein